MTSAIINRNYPKAISVTGSNRESKTNFRAVDDSFAMAAAGTYPFASIRFATTVAAEEVIIVAGKTYEFVEDPEVGPTGSNVAIDIEAAQTAAAGSDAFVVAFNADPPPGQNLVAVGISDNEVLIIRSDNDVVPDAVSWAQSETMAGSGNATDAVGRTGTARGAQHAVVTRVPTAQEVALGKLHIPLPFTPLSWHIRVVTTSTAAVVVWDGAAAVTAASGDVPAILSLDNAGMTDWAATMTVQAWIYG